MPDIVPKDIRPAFPEHVPDAAVRDKLRELLGLDEMPADVDFSAAPAREEDGIRVTPVTFRNSLGETVPGIVMVPLADRGTRLPGVVCIPGTSGSAQQVADLRFEDPTAAGQVLGSGRELARRGFATIAISIKGTVSRRDSPQAWEQEAKFLVAYGRPQMGVIAEEALRAARVLAADDAVDSDRIGLTGMSLGGLATWYAMAVEPWIRVGAPVCGGLGSMAANIHGGLPDRSSSAIFLSHMLRYFDHAQIVAACVAPRPFMTVAPTNDEDMPRAGVDELVRVVAPTYEDRGHGQRFRVYQPEGNHVFLVRYFEWMAAWFERFLKVPAP